MWVDGDTLRVAISHHGAPVTHPCKVEVNIVDIQTGKTVMTRTVDGLVPGHSAAVVREVLTVPLHSIQPMREVITTRLVHGVDRHALPETVHPVLTQGASIANMSWIGVGPSAVTLTFKGLHGTTAIITLTNNAKTPLFYVAISTAFEGYFSENSLFLLPESTKTVGFVFTSAHGVPDIAQFEKSLRVDWLNKN